MTYLKLAGPAALAAALGANPALADITPEEVWQNWQQMSAGYGQTMTAASAVREGDTLVVSDLSVTQNRRDATVDLVIERVNFADNGDGTVDITLSDRYAIDLRVPARAGAEGARPTDLTIAISQPGMVTTVSGTPDATAYTVVAPSITIGLDAVNGVDPAVEEATVQATMTALSGNYTVAGPADAKVIKVEFGAQNVTLAVQGKDPDTKADFRMTGTMADLAVGYALDLGGRSLTGANVAEALKAGISFAGRFGHGPLDLAIDVAEETGPNRIAATAASGGMVFAMDAGGLVYEVTGTDSALTISGADIPFPEVKASYADVAMKLSVPLLATPDLTDFAFLTRVVDLSVSEEIWGLIDPAGSLPHDPATLVLDTKGKMRLTTDIVDETAMAALGEAAPGEIHALDLTEIRATLAGADLTGAGALTFDNGDLVTFDGVPAPTGRIDLKLTGGNLLLDTLVAMGLVTQDNANNARLLISMFANPGAGADELTSTLEFKDKGFYANGQRLK